MNYKDTDFYRPNVVQPHPGIFVFDLFKPQLCKELLTRAALAPVSAPNSMNKYGVDLADLKLSSWLQQVMRVHIAPIARDYYPEVGTLEKPYGFLVQYAGGKQRGLKRHVDAPSAVTLNVCLGEQFHGGDLVFYGPRGERFVIAHRQGQAIVHRGHHEHQAQKIIDGRRTNLILWCGSK